jgi:hypothetical protein
MKIHRSERHRLTTLQRQIMKWLKMEGGGCLRADRLFSSMVRNHTTPGADAALLSERYCEAVENLCRHEYAEVRLEGGQRQKKTLSLYDFGRFSQLMAEEENGDFHWKNGECPMIALTDSGSRYADSL